MDSEDGDADTGEGLLDQAEFRRKLYAQLKSTGVVNAVKVSQGGLVNSAEPNGTLTGAVR